MEVNRDEAERCLQIAKQRLAQGNFAAALKFAKKSVSMYPTTDSKSFLAKLEQSTETGAAGAAPRPNASAAAGKSSPSPSAAPNPQDQGGLRNRGSKGHSSSSSPKPYTKEQLDAVNKIRACRNDHYKVLSVERTASEADIKKAYKKVQ
ncbi:Chaperone protein dnaJ, partial [Spiromyces aspiralis]